MTRQSLAKLRLGAPKFYAKTTSEPERASISDDTIQMDHNPVVLFTIDRLARSPRTAGAYAGH